MQKQQETRSPLPASDSTSPGAAQSRPPQARRLGPVGRCVLIVAVAYLSCAFAYLLSLNQLEHMPLWPAAGVGFAFGWRYGAAWTLPAAIGAAAWSFLTTRDPTLTIAAALVTVAGPLAALGLLQRLNEWKPTEYRLEAAIRLLLAVVLVSAPLNAAFAAVAIHNSPQFAALHPLHGFISWWLLDALGTLLLAPVIVASARGGIAISGDVNKSTDPWADFAALGITALIVLTSLLVSEIGRQNYAYSLVYFVIPVVAWASIRCSEKTNAFTLLACAAMVLGGRALQLSPVDQVGPPIIEASLLVFVAVMVGILLQSVAADRRLALERVGQQARQDMSTGLLNDRGLLAEFGDRLAAPNRPHYGLLGLHISNFDTLNDLCGSISALQLEQSIAALLTRQPGVKAAARLSAGRYAILVDAETLADARAVARSIYSTLSGQVHGAANGSVRLQACVGGLHIDRHAQINSEDCLVSLSDAQAIAASVRDPQLFVEPLSQTMIDARRAHQNKIEHIRESIREHRFQAHAQPIIDPNTPPGKISYEVLIRLLDHDDGLIQPPEFMSLAVQAQMTPAMDRGVITRVFSWLSENPDALSRTHKCSINLSGLTMSDGMIPAFIREERVKYGIPPACIVFEITESEAIRNPAAASRLIDELKADGFGIALDDFGVGLATFEYLKRFPIDYLKIDGSFVRNLTTSPIDEEIVLSTVRVARRLNVQTVAEHVQSQEIYERLQALGVGHFQGEHLGRVLPLDKMFKANFNAQSPRPDSPTAPAKKTPAQNLSRQSHV